MPSPFYLGKGPHYPVTKGWMGPRAGLVDLEMRKIWSLLGLQLGQSVDWLFGGLVGCLLGSLVGWWDG